MSAGFRKVDPAGLQRLLEESGITYRTNARSYVFTCPRCAKKDKLMMFRQDGRFICWVCAESDGFKGRPEYALTELLQMSIPDIRQKIYGDSFEQLPTDYLNIQLRDFFDEDAPDDIKPPRPMKWPLDFFPIEHKFSLKGALYLEGRGIDLELAMSYGIRYCPVQRRVIFPIMCGGQLYGWQARAIFPTEWEDEDGNTRKAPKILTTGKRDSVLMFQDRLAGSEHAVICEGPVDAIKCHLAGGNVATMGKVVSKQQIELIRNSGIRKVYLALDPDAATETMRLMEAFDQFEMYRLLPAPGFKDLGEMPLELVRDQVQRAPRIYRGMLFLHFKP